MLIASIEEADREAAAGGADRFLAKPFSPLELELLVRDLLARG
jgi:CheY-like chemotaxis protein